MCGTAEGKWRRREKEKGKDTCAQGQTKGALPRTIKEKGKMHVVSRIVLPLPTCAHARSLSLLYGTGQALRRRKPKEEIFAAAASCAYRCACADMPRCET